MNIADKKEINIPLTIDTPSIEQRSIYSVLNVGIFFSILFFGGLLSLLLPKAKISDIEKRKLCPFPTFGIVNLLEGSYTDSIELYYADNFPFRESFVSVASTFKAFYGYRAEEIMIYTIEKKKEPRIKSSTKGVAKIGGKDTLSLAKLDTLVLVDDTLENDGEFVESVFIYGGKAFQMFGGSATTAKPFSAMVNQYQKSMGAEVQFYCMEIPTPIDFYLPAKYKSKNNYEKPNIDLVYAALDSGIVPVYAYEELKKHTGEYLYFNTDHHWTGLAGYYAYRAFCAAAGLVPYELASFQKKTKKKFLGTLYALTQDKRLKENIDSVAYFKLPIATTCSYYLDEKNKKGIASKLYAETASGGNSYSVFLGGDNPLVRVNTPIKNGRRIVIIKDSYGNAFAPYLALHYEQVFIIDYRYFKSNIPEFIKEYKITDFIFAHNTFVVNSRYTSIKEMALLKSYKGKAKAVKINADSLMIKVDTVK